MNCLQIARRWQIRYWPSWASHRLDGRLIGPRPLLGLHRTPDPQCPTCGGTGSVMCAVPGSEEPDYDDCHCAPFLPVAWLWLPKVPRWARRLRRCRSCRTRPCSCPTEPPF